MIGRKNYFGNQIEPACLYCKCGKPSCDGMMILCKKTGIVEQDYNCKKFEYEPLKRIPPPQLVLQKYTNEDFEL